MLADGLETPLDMSAMLLVVPFVAPGDGTSSFTASLLAFLGYEFLVGVMLPCEGVIRSLYFPANARASIMTLPSIIVNFSVCLGVISTNVIRYVPNVFPPIPSLYG